MRLGMRFGARLCSAICNNAFMSAKLRVLPIFFCCAAAAQEIGPRDFGRTVDSEAVPPPAVDEMNIELWLPADEFAEEVRESLMPAVSMSSIMKTREQNAPQHIRILPDNALKLWRVTLSNGSAGNWGVPPANYLDARTLSFPTP